MTSSLGLCVCRARGVSACSDTGVWQVQGWRRGESHMGRVGPGEARDGDAGGAYVLVVGVESGEGWMGGGRRHLCDGRSKRAVWGVLVRGGGGEHTASEGPASK